VPKWHIYYHTTFLHRLSEQLHKEKQDERGDTTERMDLSIVRCDCVHGISREKAWIIECVPDVQSAWGTLESNIT